MKDVYGAAREGVLIRSNGAGRCEAGVVRGEGNVEGSKGGVEEWRSMV